MRDMEVSRSVSSGHSLLSALALLTFAAFLHLATSKHATVVGLKELGSLIQRLGLLPLLVLLLLDDRVEALTSAFLFDTLGPLLLNLGQLLLLVLEIGLSFVTLLVLLAHLLIIGLKRTCVLLVGVLETLEKVLLRRSIGLLH